MAKTFPILYHKGKGGKLYSWQVSSLGDTITTVAGTVTGLKTTTAKKVEQKNVGRSNETNLEEQADKEAFAMWTHKKERKYSETEAGAKEELFLPMLAEEFDSKKKKLIYPVDVQPKFDGVRCLAHKEDGKVTLTSRSGKEWTTVPHINEELEKIMEDGDVLDGEIYLHGKNFQEITRLVKKTRPESCELQYCVYDKPSELPWKERKEELRKLLTNSIRKNAKVLYVMSTVCHSEEEVIATHDKAVAEGYEGAIVRSHLGMYLYGYRSSDLLKVKRFDDAEFIVRGYERGVGRYANSVIWKCETETGKEFKVNPKISIAEKETYLKEAEQYIGLPLKVRFFGRSEEGTPRFPVGIGFRLKEDMS